MFFFLLGFVDVYFELLIAVLYLQFFFFKQKTAYEMRISDWSSDVCSSDLIEVAEGDRRVAALTVQRIDETITDGVARQVAIGPGIGELALIRCLALRIGIAAAPVHAQPDGNLELAGHLCVDTLALIPGARRVEIDAAKQRPTGVEGTKVTVRVS